MSWVFFDEMRQLTHICHHVCAFSADSARLTPEASWVYVITTLKSPEISLMGPLIVLGESVGRLRG